MPALTQMPSVWGDLGLNAQPGAQQNQGMLNDEEELARKKKLLAAGQNPMQSAAQILMGSRTPGSTTVF